MLQYPKDANGILVPLDTTSMYRKNGNRFPVTDFFYEARADKWFARKGSECVEVNKLYLEIEVEQDSWERLESGLKMCADYSVESGCVSPICLYALNKDETCFDCKFHDDANCECSMCSDILNRIRNLRGETHDC